MECKMKYKSVYLTFNHQLDVFSLLYFTLLWKSLEIKWAWVKKEHKNKFILWMFWRLNEKYELYIFL